MYKIQIASFLIQIIIYTLEWNVLQEWAATNPREMRIWSWGSPLGPKYRFLFFKSSVVFSGSECYCKIKTTNCFSHGINTKFKWINKFMISLYSQYNTLINICWWNWKASLIFQQSLLTNWSQTNSILVFLHLTCSDSNKIEASSLYKEQGKLQCFRISDILWI